MHQLLVSFEMDFGEQCRDDGTLCKVLKPLQNNVTEMPWLVSVGLESSRAYIHPECDAARPRELAEGLVIHAKPQILRS